MKLNWTSGAVLGWGHFAPSGTLMLLKPWPLYKFTAPGLFRSQCNAMARHPQLLARVSALTISFLAIPFRRNLSRTATFDTYAIPVLWREYLCLSSVIDTRWNFLVCLQIIWIEVRFTRRLDHHVVLYAISTERVGECHTKRRLILSKKDK